MFKFKLLLVVAVASLSIVSTASASVWYVDKDNASGLEDGVRWSSAFATIDAAVAAAAIYDEVWVAEGVYDEMRAGSDNAPGSLIMKAKVGLYGGFAGTESLRTERDWEAHTTVIDGSRARDGAPAFHVLVGANKGVLDGFTITGGRTITIADDPEEWEGWPLWRWAMGGYSIGERYSNGTGGGMYNGAIEIAITHCRFEVNEAIFGGALFNDADSNATVAHCTFTGNSSESSGGAVASYKVDTHTFSDCTFSGNTAGKEGGAICAVGINAHSSLALTRCTFSNNQAGTAGGGVHVYQSVTCILAGCLFDANSADGSSGGMFVSGPRITVDNSLFRNNSANNTGGLGISGHDNVRVTNSQFLANRAAEKRGGLSYSGSTQSSFLMENCIVTDNEAPETAGVYLSSAYPYDNSLEDATMSVANCVFAGNLAGAGLYKHTNGSLTVSNSIFWENGVHQIVADGVVDVSYSLVQNGYDGIGNISGEPLFGEDYRLLATSPGVDAGTNTGAPPKDIEGTWRPQGEGVDMGAYELFVGPDADGDGLADDAESTEDFDEDGLPDYLDPDSDNDGVGDGVEGPVDSDLDGIADWHDLDSDNDGIGDGLEAAFGLDRTDPSDAAADPDNDGMTSSVEVNDHGTNPFLNDTDGDGLPDDWELAQDLDPLDASDGEADLDGDLLPNIYEYRIASDIGDPASPPLDLYVAPNGDDIDGLGTANSPWQTIARAMTAANIYTAWGAVPLGAHHETIHLAEGNYEEKVTFVPDVTLVGAADALVTIEYYDNADPDSVVVVGAENTVIADCTITLPSVNATGMTLLNIDNVAMEVANVVLDGRFTQYSTGIRVTGEGSSDSVIHDSLIDSVEDGIWAVDTGVTITKTKFRDILDDAVFVNRPRNAKQLANNAVPLLGQASNSATGQNEFSDIDGYLVRNTSGTLVAAEDNDWGLYTEAEIAAKMNGEVDFMPFIGAIAEGEDEGGPGCFGAGSGVTSCKNCLSELALLILSVGILMRLKRRRA